MEVDIAGGSKTPKKKLTTGFGMPVDDDLSSVTAGERGPVVMQDTHLLDKLAHFDRERIPERVVHAKRAGAHGYFEVTDDVTRYTRAAFLSEVGKKTEQLRRPGAGSRAAAAADRHLGDGGPPCVRTRRR